MLPSLALWMLALAAAGPVDLLILTDRGSRKIDARYENGRRYLELRDIARAFGLGLREANPGTLIVSAPRGELRLSAGRVLVRTPAEDLVLSAPARRRSRTRWWVPEDFLTRALAGVIRARLLAVERGYRAVPLPTARVAVSVDNYPDHVSLVFSSSLPIDESVRELEDHLEVRLGAALVDAAFEGGQPAAGAVRKLSFVDADRWGSFRIEKGPGFQSHRVSRGGARLLTVDLFWRADPGARVAGAPPATTGPPPRTGTDPPQSRSARPQVVIDPGHGGQDSGWALPDSDEKSMTLALATRLASELGRQGVRTELTRRRDITLGSEPRSSVGNHSDAAVFIGLHVGRQPGTQIYVYGDPLATEPFGAAQQDLLRWEEAYRPRRLASWRLARRLQHELDVFNPEARTPVEAPLDVLRSLRQPAVVVEVGVDADGRPLPESPVGRDLVRAIARVLP